jgi:uncharacterized repeat protein (TIGR01451 family)
MNKIILTTLFACYTFTLLWAQTPVAAPVTLELLPAFPLAPFKMANVDERWFAVFDIYERNLHTSIDKGATWTVLASFPDDIADLEVLDNQLFVFTQNTVDSTTYFKVRKSTDLGLSFTEVHSFVEIWTKLTNGNSLNSCRLGNIVSANGVLFLNYISRNKTGNAFFEYFRGFYSPDGGTTWNYIQTPTLLAHGPAENILFHNGEYIFLSGSVSGSIADKLAVYKATSPAFANPINLPFQTGTFSSHTSAIHNGKLIIMGNSGSTFTRNDFSPNVKFTTSNIGIQPWEAFFANGYFYYVTHQNVYRAPADDPSNRVLVLSNFSRTPPSSYQEQRFHQAQNDLILLSELPILSTDNGLTWKLLPLVQNHSWSGEVYQFNNTLYFDNSWAMRDAGGLNFEFWNPQGIAGEYFSYWKNVVAHKGSLYLITVVPDPANPGSDEQVLLRSDDNGSNWSQILTLPDESMLQLYPNGNRLFLMAKATSTSTGARIYYTDNKGASWSSFLPMPNTYAYSFAAQGDTAYLLSTDKLYFTHNSGQNWASTTLITSNFNSKSFLTIGQQGNPVVAHYNRIIATSNDGGQTLYKAYTLPGTTTDFTYYQLDSLLLGVQNSAGNLFVSKGGLTNWLALKLNPDLQNIKSAAVHNGYLYLTHSDYGLTSSFSRIPMDQILDPLNNLSMAAGIVTGKIFYDANANCQQNAGEIPAENRMVRFEPGGYVGVANAAGLYGVALPPGAYTAQTSVPAYHVSACTNPTSFSLVNGLSLTKNVAYQPSTQVKDLKIRLLSTRIRPGLKAHFSLQVENEGTQPVPAGTQLRFLYGPDKLTLQNTTPFVAVNSAGEVVFTLPEIAAYTQETFRVSLELDADPNLLGEILSFSAQIVDNYGDVDLLDNLANLDVTVTGSFDPNDKTPITGALGGRYILKTDSTIQYLIRFQNTGNDTAFSVVIRDTLGLEYTPKKGIKTLATSHPARFVLRGGRIAEWHFNPIELPDSTTNEPASHGYVLFEVPIKAERRSGMILRNKAAIYFDFNHPIITNTASTKMVSRLIWRDDIAVEDLEVSVQVAPNPVAATAVFTILGANAPLYTNELIVTDLQGRQVSQQRFVGNSHEWSRSGLPDGIYFWQIWQNGQLLKAGELVVSGW